MHRLVFLGAEGFVTSGEEFDVPVKAFAHFGFRIDVVYVSSCLFRVLDFVFLC